MTSTCLRLRGHYSVDILVLNQTLEHLLGRRFAQDRHPAIRSPVAEEPHGLVDERVLVNILAVLGLVRCSLVDQRADDERPGIVVGRGDSDTGRGGQSR
ncbi:hypothetical protein PG994_006841 [Apiospora phragmitis]|uniref:Uncharacterized protein n=1 Tax=Apiospora phragmitis TaxID=2905665 RepID=A0ABR1VG81_9PEZI